MRALLRGLCLVLLAASCTAGSDERPRQQGAPIVGRDAHVDDVHAAVVAVLGEGGRLCSGAVIARNAAGDTLDVLTAAHCCGASAPPQTVAIGGDYSQPTRTLAVTKYRQHPCYNGLGHEYDFCVLSASDGSPVNVRPIPLSTGQDHLARGSHVTLVGYGSTPASNVARRRVEATLAVVTPSMLELDQTDGKGGVCFGDSGGPVLVDEAGVEVVAGVASFGAPTSLCDVIGVAGRVDAPGVGKGFVDKALAGEDSKLADVLVLREGTTSGPVHDTYIDSGAPDKNFGDSVVLEVGAPPGSAAVRRALIRFDLLGVPAGVTVLSAFVGLHQESRTGPATISVYRVTRDWDEDSETWSSFGERGFDPAPLAALGNATAVVTSTDQLWFDLTETTRAWLAGRTPNDGIMLATSEAAQTQLMSSEIGRLSERPWLHVCYAPATR